MEGSTFDFHVISEKDCSEEASLTHYICQSINVAAATTHRLPQTGSCSNDLSKQAIIFKEIAATMIDTLLITYPDLPITLTFFSIIGFSRYFPVLLLFPTLSSLK